MQQPTLVFFFESLSSLVGLFSLSFFRTAYLRSISNVGGNSTRGGGIGSRILRQIFPDFYRKGKCVPSQWDIMQYAKILRDIFFVLSQVGGGVTWDMRNDSFILVKYP